MVGGGVARAEHIRVTEEPFVGVNDGAVSATWSGASNKRKFISPLAYYKSICKSIVSTRTLFKMSE